MVRARGVLVLLVIVLAACSGGEAPEVLTTGDPQAEAPVVALTEPAAADAAEPEGDVEAWDGFTTLDPAPAAVWATPAPRWATDLDLPIDVDPAADLLMVAAAADESTVAAWVEVGSAPDGAPQPTLVVLDRDSGEVRWTRASDAPFGGDLLLHDDLLVIEDEGAILALDVQDGMQRWAIEGLRTPRLVSRAGTPIVVALGDLHIIDASDGTLTSHPGSAVGVGTERIAQVVDNPDGQVVQLRGLDGEALVSIPVDAAGILHVAPVGDGVAVAADGDLTLLDDAGQVVGEQPVEGGINALVPAGNGVVVVTSDGLRAVDADGAVVGTSSQQRPFQVLGDRVLVGAEDGVVDLTTGAVVAPGPSRLFAGGQLVSAADGTLIATDLDGSRGWELDLAVDEDPPWGLLAVEDGILVGRGVGLSLFE